MFCWWKGVPKCRIDLVEPHSTKKFIAPKHENDLCTFYTMKNKMYCSPVSLTCFCKLQYLCMETFEGWRLLFDLGFKPKGCPNMLIWRLTEMPLKSWSHRAGVPKGCFDPICSVSHRGPYMHNNSGSQMTCN
jgi:hypothetical protein